MMVQAQTWEKQFPFFDAKDIVETNDGMFVMAGNTYADETGKTDVFLSKINEQGDLLWTKEYGLQNNNAVFAENIVSAMIATQDGGFAIAGSTNGHVFLIKANANGNLEWQKTYGGGKNIDWAGEAIDLTSDGAAIIALDNGRFGFVKTKPF